MSLTGTFYITDWQETIERQHSSGQTLCKACSTQNYTGDIVGTSEVVYLLYYGTDGNAAFTGFETLTSKEKGKTIYLTLQHRGKFENGIASSHFSVLNASQSTLINKTGYFKSIEGGKSFYQIQ